VDEISLARRDINVINVDALGATGGLDEVAHMVDEGGITIRLEHTFPMEATCDALAEMKTGHIYGKVVLTVS